MQEKWAAIAEVGEGGEAGLDGPVEHRGGRITVPGRHEDPLVGKPASRGEVGVTFRRKGDQPYKPAAGSDEFPRCLRSCRQHMFGRMGADKPRLRIDERALNMDASHHVGDHRIGRVEFRKPADAGGHPIEPVGDDRGQHPAAAILPHRLARGAKIAAGEIVGVEVDAFVAVELQVERLHRRLFCQCVAGAEETGGLPVNMQEATEMLLQD